MSLLILFAICFVVTWIVIGIIFYFVTKKPKSATATPGTSRTSSSNYEPWLYCALLLVIFGVTNWILYEFCAEYGLFTGKRWWAPEVALALTSCLWVWSFFSKKHIPAIRWWAIGLSLLTIFVIWKTVHNSRIQNEVAQQTATSNVRGNRQRTVTLSNDWQRFEDLTLGDSAVLFCPLGKMTIKNNGKEYAIIDGRLENSQNPDALPTGGNAEKIVFFLRAGDDASIGRKAVIFYGPKSEILRAGGH